jgi:hypothetical protein
LSDVPASETSLRREVVSQKLASGCHVCPWNKVACLWDRKEGKPRVSAIVPSNSTVICTICNIIRLAGLTPKLVPILLKGLQVMHPSQLSHRSIPLIVGAGIDEDVKTTIECQHAVIEVSPVDILLRVDGFIHFLIVIDELRIKKRVALLSKTYG